MECVPLLSSTASLFFPAARRTLSSASVCVAVWRARAVSWEIFRCNVDCEKEPDNCISERLYHQQADALVSQGFLDMGYNAIHMDDCWERKVPPRDPETGRLVGDPIRFPSGMKALGDYYHSKGAKYALYTAESPTTCGGYPASANHEMLDAETFADWGVE